MDLIEDSYRSDQQTLKRTEKRDLLLPSCRLAGFLDSSRATGGEAAEPRDEKGMPVCLAKFNTSSTIRKMGFEPIRAIISSS